MSFEQDEHRTQNVNAMGFEFFVDADAQVVDADPHLVDARAQMVADEQLADAAIDTEDHLAPDTESDILHWRKPPLMSKETLGSLAQQFSPLLVPLPFAGLIFLLTLPATLQGPPNHPAPLVMGMLLLALAILQGTLLYFAGANKTLWLLDTIGGYALFIALGIGAAFGWVPALATLVALVVLGIIPVRRGIHPTKEGYVDMVEAFGKYTHTLYPGLNLLMPWEKVTQRLNVQETTWTCEEQRVSISREQFVRLKATISYHLWPDDAHLAVQMTRDWESSLRVLFVGTLQSMVNALTPADFVSWSQSLYMPTSSEGSSFNPTAATRWDRINEALSKRVQDQVAAWGVEINWVRIQEPVILPHAVGGQTVLVDAGATQVSKPNPPVAQVPVAEKRVETVQATPSVAAPVASAPPPPKIPKGKALKVETLVDMYNAVRQGVITDPATILETAQRFEQLASDPEASKMLDFDAARAANTLRQRAQKFQERANASALNTQQKG